MQAGRGEPGVTDGAGATPGQRFVRSAGEIPFLELEGLQHPGGDRQVFRFASMRGAGERQFVVTPDQLVEAAGFEERHHLKRLRARPPRRLQKGIPRRADQPRGRFPYRGMHAMAGLHGLPATDDHVELVGLHVGKIAGATRAKRTESPHDTDGAGWFPVALMTSGAQLVRP